MAKIFWVEDQSHWIDKFRDVLEKADLDGSTPNVIEVYRFSEAARQRISLAKKDTDRPDVALLDAKMNGFDEAGFSVSTALRKKWPDLPIVFLSEHAGTDIERSAIETHQVQDFISKNQRNIEEVLVWRMKAAIRQSSVLAQGGENASDILTSGDLKIDLDNWEVYWKGNKLMNPDNPKRPLAPTPRKILRCLVERTPRPVTPFQMAEYLNIDPHTYAAATFRQHIKTLRRAFDCADNKSGEFLELCKKGYGVVAVGEEGAYCWKPPK
ncbi:MAG: response regulator [Gammaproteobacteria bacterium]|nr:response regulator [Gammaproteobacteria bacterium]MDH5694081.1 response regulator [Gammaproteobacteria bacterium]